MFSSAACTEKALARHPLLFTSLYNPPILKRASLAGHAQMLVAFNTDPLNVGEKISIQKKINTCKELPIHTQRQYRCVGKSGSI